MAPKTIVALTIAMATSAVTADAFAEPQGTAGLTVGAAGRGYDDDYFHEPAFHVGLRGDVMFGRGGVDDVGVGPYAEVLTHAFDEIQFGGGASLLIPILDSTPLVLSVGPYARYSLFVELEPGIASSVFFGSRSYNFSSNYVMSLGFIAQARVGLGATHETSFVFGLQVDLGFAALPFMFLAEAMSGGSPETDTIPGK